MSSQHNDRCKVGAPTVGPHGRCMLLLTIAPLRALAVHASNAAQRHRALSLSREREREKDIQADHNQQQAHRCE